MNHELKIWPESYKGIIDKVKRFEVRKNDRNFKVGDQLILREFIPCPICHGTGRAPDHTDFYECVDCNKSHGKYTGDGCVVSVDYILEGEEWGITKGYCVMSITVTASRKKY